MVYIRFENFCRSYAIVTLVMITYQELIHNFKTSELCSHCYLKKPATILL